MKTWLRDHLIATGAISERGTGRRARVRTCNRCGASVLTGLTDPKVCAIDAQVDPAPLNQLGELLARAQRRYTVTARAEAGRYVLDDRDSFAIEGGPAGTRPREDVMAEHRCHQPIPDIGHAPSGFAPRERRPITHQPPF